MQDRPVSVVKIDRDAERSRPKRREITARAVAVWWRGGPLVVQRPVRDPPIVGAPAGGPGCGWWYVRDRRGEAPRAGPPAAASPATARGWPRWGRARQPRRLQLWVVRSPPYLLDSSPCDGSRAMRLWLGARPLPRSPMTVTAHGREMPPTSEYSRPPPATRGYGISAPLKEGPSVPLPRLWL